MARTPLYRRAPEPSARGTYETFVDRLAPLGQPKSHTPAPSHSGALRRTAKCDQPSTSAPRPMMRATPPRYCAREVATCRTDSTRSKYGASSSGVRSDRPCSRAHLSRIQSGVRKQVPVLMVVEPPTVMPMGIITGQLPTVRVVVSRR